MLRQSPCGSVAAQQSLLILRETAAVVPEKHRDSLAVTGVDLSDNRGSIMEKMYFVYIITNAHNTVLYTGVTNDLIRRIHEHKNKQVKGFSGRYNLNKLVYFEQGTDVYEAITREKQIKAGSRQKKIDLIDEMNPEWLDLFKTLI